MVELGFPLAKNKPFRGWIRSENDVDQKAPNAGSSESAGTGDLLVTCGTFQIGSLIGNPISPHIRCPVRLTGLVCSFDEVR